MRAELTLLNNITGFKWGKFLQYINLAIYKIKIVMNIISILYSITFDGINLKIKTQWYI